MRYRATTVLAFSLAIFVFWSLDAEAQLLATSFEQLQVLVKAGDTVAVTDVAGNVTRGRIEELSRSSLRLVGNGVASEVSETNVAQIEQRRSDPLGNGAKNGALVGAGIGATMGILFGALGDSGLGVAVAAIYTGLGAGVGVGIDALIVRTQVIYQGRNRAPSTRINISPLLQRGSKGIRLSVSF